tara:strand:+ start:7584 stop:7748 length:165 start_codon:yes stop_codon:yes gene_type:complete
MRIKVTFQDVFEVENEEEAYDLMVEYCYLVGRNKDVTGFNFEEFEDTPNLEPNK